MVFLFCVSRFLRFDCFVYIDMVIMNKYIISCLYMSIVRKTYNTIITIMYCIHTQTKFSTTCGLLSSERGGGVLGRLDPFRERTVPRTGGALWQPHGGAPIWRSQDAPLRERFWASWRRSAAATPPARCGMHAPLSVVGTPESSREHFVRATQLPVWQRMGISVLLYTYII